MNMVMRFFRLRDELEARPRPTTWEEDMLLAYPPATSSEAGAECRVADPASYRRLVELHETACRAARAAGY